MKEENIKEIFLNFNKYDNRPVYSCQVNKNNCRLILEVEGSTDSRFIENNGESMMLPLNPLLIKSGLQKIIVKIYPFEGQEYIDAGANVGLTFYNAPDKDSNLTDYKKIATFSLPKNIGEQKLPYYESVIEFKVDIPFDYSEELDNSFDLTLVSGFEEKIIDKYKVIRNLGLSFEGAKYNKERLHHTIKHLNSMYHISKKDAENSEEFISFMEDRRLKKRVFLPIKNYHIQYYANGKIAALWQKKLKPMLYIKGEFTNGQGELINFEGGDPIFLYMPKDSNELKIW
ncbi:hypothetical protein J2Q11_13290 [Tenacibaculum finnmarkense genomovar finnmarkense]|nr:hypothetical protein [Tenacibaculum finnmarkense]MBE7649200.1 hypothetical protein [Tenacibaculum finnmarkense genomovar ulcerans]MCD8401233.1 hypothetical protein [Tenacibaculum finnmarkense genomovar ulcerans]MCD8430943.1 hypothetical protein [Tenacibaculum finnmarkense genomovar ulcerans]MCG8221121.1 hypothetical protein [Tenacibaculum finnmarkense genomovar finnmarkense]MCG8226671.1 hypothetical protein [Tenacibaculum finnmarkense genomovar finnmarkense]